MANIRRLTIDEVSEVRGWVVGYDDTERVYVEYSQHPDSPEQAWFAEVHDGMGKVIRRVKVWLEGKKKPTYAMARSLAQLALTEVCREQVRLQQG